MANVYVGTTSAGAANGTSWTNRYGTLNAAEDRPLSAGDVVYVGPGTYRELLTVDVSGTVGNPITYIGDYTGANTDGVGGIVRITGAANETTTGTRASCITATSKNYRTFRGFLFDGASASLISCATDHTNWTIDQCVFRCMGVGGAILFNGTQSAHAVTNCVFVGAPATSGTPTNGGIIGYNHSSTVDNCAHTVKSCLFIAYGFGSAINTARVGGITISNCSFIGGAHGVRVSTALTSGQLVTVNNCIICDQGTAGVRATVSTEFSEDYNAFFNNVTNRTSVNTGSNSVGYPPGHDMRPFFNAFNAGTLVLPLASLASYSGLVEYSAGTGAPSTDWRGHAAAGSLREWGVEEFVSTYGVEGGGVTMWPLSQSFIQGIIGAG